MDPALALLIAIIVAVMLWIVFSPSDPSDFQF